MQSSTAARVVEFGLAILTIVIRIASHLGSAFNFNSVGALGLFGGARLKSWQAYAAPIAVMVVTDLGLAVIKGDEYGLLHPSRIWVYGCFLLYVVIGRTVIGDSKNPFVIVAASLLGTAQFFLITNFCEWLVQPVYSRDIWGLIDSYWSAILFLKFSLAADLIFAPAAFLAHHFLTRDVSIAEESLHTASAGR